MKFLIDADCAIYTMVGEYALLRQRMEQREPGDIGLSTISLAEIALGAALGKGPSQDRLEAFLRAIPPVPFDTAAARAYAHLPFKRARFDRLLAAHALSLDVAIITNNEVDFADVPGLRIENWTR